MNNGDRKDNDMIEDRIRRAFVADDISVERSGDGRTVVVRAVTYGKPYMVSDDGRTRYREVWRSGVFNRTMAHRGGRIPLIVQHDRRRWPVGATQGIEGDGKDAFVVRTRISKTRDGDDALELINDGALTGISLGARPLVNRDIEGGVERVEARLDELSLTPFPQMDDAGVLAVRSDDLGDTLLHLSSTDEVPDDVLERISRAGGILTPDEVREIEGMTPAATPSRLDAAREFLASLTVGVE